MTADIDERFVALVHELWCAHMTGKGWRPSDHYDGQALTHDAMRPFERLDAQDRADIQIRVRSSGLLEQLIRLIEYPRGPDRPLRLEEIKPGLPVRLAPEVTGDGYPDEVGRIVSWKDDGMLITLVRVQWPDGQSTDHVPSERDLERVGW